MSHLSRRGVLLGLSVAFSLAACMGPTFVVQQYAGAPKSKDEIAILRVNGKDPVRLLVLDGQDVAAPIVEDGRLHIEVLPGEHSAVVGNANAPGERYAPMKFDAVAGKVYRFGFPNGAIGEAHVFEVSRGDDTIVRDVTKLEPMSPPVVRPAPVVEDAGPPAEATIPDAG
jgi:hypothetical protein